MEWLIIIIVVSTCSSWQDWQAKRKFKKEMDEIRKKDKRKEWWEDPQVEMLGKQHLRRGENGLPRSGSAMD
jgi:hypothetical protein